VEPHTDRQSLEVLEADVRDVRAAMLAAEATHADRISAAHPAHRRSAANLVHYVELRRHDMRDLQARLAAVGLSSLGRSEAHVLATVEAVLMLLAELNDREPIEPAAAVSLTEGHTILAHNTERLLGAGHSKRSTRIMVTMPSEAADQPALVASMVGSGMDIARVNCAHDGPDAWERMVSNVRATARSNGEAPLVAMDLGGPKVRTGPLQAGPRVVRVTPRRDQLGAVTAPAHVWLGADCNQAQLPPATTIVPVDDADWLRRRRAGDRLEFVDARGSKRRWEVLEVDSFGCLASATQSAYVTSGLTIVCRSGEHREAVTVGELPEIERVHRITEGDQLMLTRSLEPAEATGGGSPHRIGCTLAEVFGQAKPGERVWLDDGKIGGTIRRADHDWIEMDITDVRPGGANLRAGKGINFPDTDLQLAALTSKDLVDLDFVVRHADLVDLSFVRVPEDVEQLQAELAGRDAEDLGIVLKIENATAFQHLPELLLTALRSRNVGLMIARGDLAVEVGFERLAEVQEEIMWACEAAHVPVIWATQVLDTLARTGQASRAEVTDAAMSERAECVMLNKGPYIAEAIHALDSILCRMHQHQHKKHSLLRRLRAWDHGPSD
jgi:pyruvate kinase